MTQDKLDVNKTRELLEQIFTPLNIKTLVYVDDVFAFNDLEVEKVVGWFADALAKDPQKATKIIAVPYPVPDEDIWKRDFRSKWANLPPGEQRNTIEQLKLLLNSQLEADTKVTQKIGKILPRHISYEAWSPSTWQEKKGDLLADSSDDSKILCLFDQDLRHDIGFREKGSLSGGGLLNEIVSGEHSTHVICGILSHTIPAIKDEINYRKDFASTYEIVGLDTNKFLPLSKSRLHDNTYLEFVDGIKKLALNKFVEDMKSTAIGVLEESHIQAVGKLRELDVYAFDLMILAASRKSGVGAWEAETIIRISQIFQRDTLRELLFSDKAVEFNQLVEASRPISQIEVLQEENVYPWVRSVRRQELYESNNLTKYSPLQVGDIFEKTGTNGNTQKFILLTQPCDLTVRADGARAKDIVSLVPITITEDKFNPKPERKRSLPVDSRSYWQDYWSTHVILDGYEEDPTKIAILEFKKAAWLIVDVLDLCVLNEDGASRLDLNREVVIPLQLTAGWQLMLKKKIDQFLAIKNELNEIQSSLENIPEQPIKKMVWLSSMPKLSISNFLPLASYSDGVFDFKLKRVERYRQPGADSLLKSYMQYMSRDAKGFDFSK